ncbi:hypothetical protein [Microbispora sp. CA-102843]|uniref:hypothetical protein n=1 Tax=Microbispora sp. CA-102843 TaxID=3239952 RepID=UPI003D929786
MSIVTTLVAIKTVTDTVTVPLSTSGPTDIGMPVSVPSNCRVISSSFKATVSGVALTGSYLDSVSGNWLMSFRAPATTDPNVTVTVVLTVVSVE